MVLKRNRIRRKIQPRNLLTWLQEEFTLFRVSSAIVFPLDSLAVREKKNPEALFEHTNCFSLFQSDCHTLSHFIHSRDVERSIRVTERGESFSLFPLRDSKTWTDFINSQTNFFRKSFSASFSSDTYILAFALSLYLSERSCT